MYLSLEQSCSIMNIIKITFRNEMKDDILMGSLILYTKGYLLENLVHN